MPLSFTLLLCLTLNMPDATATPAPVADTPFVQEYHKPYPIGDEKEANDARAVAVDRSGQVWAATRTGAYVLEAENGKWRRLFNGDAAGPAFDAAVDTEGRMWIAAWNGLYRSSSAGLEKVPGMDAPISAVCPTKEGMAAFGPDGWWKVSGDSVERHDLPCSRSIRAAISDEMEGFWVATGMGLAHLTESGSTVYQLGDEILSANVYGVAYDSAHRLWAAGLGGATVYKDGQRTAHFTPNEGLPSVLAQCVARGPDDRMWVGTAHGVACYDGQTWSLRHSRRWLLSDDVRRVAFDPDGTAWMATARGVSAIKRRTMTLAQKADYFLDVCLKRHVREPWLVEKCLLPDPGSTEKWTPVDDDNDGQYTAMYLAMESCRYAATKAADAKANADRAFEALRFLQTVTGTEGFVARTVIPDSWEHMSDLNREYTDQERAELHVTEPRYKPVEKRWHRAGTWLWKGDTSSDEITGHFFGYAFYYDLAADENQRKVVQEHVRRIMDYIIGHGYVLVDTDGTHTRWGVWSPEKLNHDPDWRAERGINSAEILSFLKTTYHVTGDEKYQREYLALLHDHGYAENVRQAKTYEVAWRTHIDDELLALAYPGLLFYEKDPNLRALYRESLEHWYTGMRREQNALANVIYGLLTGQDPDLNGTLSMLRDTPLDLISWTIDNSTREDLHLQRAPIIDAVQTDRLPPPSERGVIRWDKNPWEAIQGGDGREEWAPTFWLLPYWMARHAGFIAPPQTQ